MIETSKNLSLDRLKTLVLVVRAGSIAAAAVGDPARQSQFSRQIKELEETVGRPLMKRDGKLLRPTQTGMELALLAGSFFAGLDEIAHESENSPILIGGNESAIRWILLPSLSKQRTTLHLKPVTMRTQEAINSVSSGEIELAIIREGITAPGVVSKRIGSLDYMWFFPRDLLPGKTVDGIYDAKRLPFAMLAGDGQLASSIREIATRNGLALDVIFELDRFSLVAEVVRSGIAGAVLPAEATSTFPLDNFAIFSGPEITVPSRQFRLVAAEKNFQMRPRIRRAFDEIVKLCNH
jgi:DNA-binding transcriptional LysR family regulator